MGRVVVLGVLAVALVLAAMFFFDDSAALIIPGALAGVLAFYYARRDAPDDFAGEYKPVVLESSSTDDRGRVRKSVIAEPQPRPAAARIPRVEYVALTAQISRAGIEARLEDGKERLVMWRDVIGIVVRRLPPVHASAPFVDLVSTAGATVRLVRWTRFMGDPLPEEMRAQVRQLVAWCPRATLDPATRVFVESGGEAAQLPDLATLVAHDEKLA